MKGLKIESMKTIFLDLLLYPLLDVVVVVVHIAVVAVARVVVAVLNCRSLSLSLRL